MECCFGNKAKIKVSVAKPIIQNISILKIDLDCNAIGLIIAVIPNTEAMLKILEPIKFPKEMAFSPLKAVLRNI